MLLCIMPVINLKVYLVIFDLILRFVMYHSGERNYKDAKPKDSNAKAAETTL